MPPDSTCIPKHTCISYSHITLYIPQYHITLHNIHMSYLMVYSLYIIHIHIQFTREV